MGKSVVLIGPKYSWKKLTGNALAKILHAPFLDADELFVEVLGSIDDFVEQNGLEVFRQYEAEIIERICDKHKDRQIVFTPGGEAVAHDQGDQYRGANRKKLSEFGEVIYLLPTSSLEESARILTERMLADQVSAGQRPSLTGEKDPFKEMLGKVRERHHFYLKAASGMVYTEGKTIKEVAQEIAQAVR